MSVARLSLPSVVGAAAANVMPGPGRFPSANLRGVLDRNRAVRQTRPTTRIIGNRAPARGHRWIATFRRGSFLLSLLTAGGMQPRLYRPKRHRLLAREAELRAVPPHAVKHHADAPGQELNMIQALGRALARHFPVFPQEGRQLQGLEVVCSK